MSLFKFFKTKISSCFIILHVFVPCFCKFFILHLLSHLNILKLFILIFFHLNSLFICCFLQKLFKFVFSSLCFIQISFFDAFSSIFLKQSKKVNYFWIKINLSFGLLFWNLRLIKNHWGVCYFDYIKKLIVFRNNIQKPFETDFFIINVQI